MFLFSCPNRSFTRCIVNPRGKIERINEAFPVRLDFSNEDASLQFVAAEVQRQGRLEEEQVILNTSFAALRGGVATSGKTCVHIIYIIIDETHK